MVMEAKHKESNFFTLFFIALTCVFIGGIIGAVTNMINGAISPYYFKKIMQWEFEEIWIASIAQGILEGVVYGLFFALVFTPSFAIITKGKGSYVFALQNFKRIIVIIFMCWAIGGLISLFLASLSPDFYRSHITSAPTDIIELIKFAWVGGSIWGEMIGGFIGIIIGIVLLINNLDK